MSPEKDNEAGEGSGEQVLRGAATRSWVCSVWRKGGSGATLLLSIGTLKEAVVRWGLVYSPLFPVIG